MEVDVMHTGCLGIVQYLMGNVLDELFTEMGGTEANEEQTCGHLNMMIKQCSMQVCNERALVNTLTRTLFRQGTKRELRAKAAEGRRMLAAVCRLLETYCSPDNDYQRLRYRCVKALADFYKEMTNWTVGSGARVGTLARQHLELYLELARHHIDPDNFLDGEWVRYRWYPKHHLFIHVVEGSLAVCDNPREWWCYGDESFLGEMISVAEAVNAKVVHRSVMTTYRL